MNVNVSNVGDFKMVAEKLLSLKYFSIILHSSETPALSCRTEAKAVRRT